MGQIFSETKVSKFDKVLSDENCPTKFCPNKVNYSLLKLILFLSN